MKKIYLITSCIHSLDLAHMKTSSQKYEYLRTEKNSKIQYRRKNMNIRSRMLKVAKKILSELDFDSPDQLRKYEEEHEIRPGTVVKINGIVVPNPNHGKNQCGNSGKKENVVRKK